MAIQKSSWEFLMASLNPLCDYESYYDDDLCAPPEEGQYLKRCWGFQHNVVVKPSKHLI